MKKERNYLIDIVVIVLLACFVGMLSGGAAVLTIEAKKNDDSDSSDLSAVTDLYYEITNNYYTDVDSETLIEGALSGMLSVLDANSSYLDSSETTTFNNKMAGEYYGIGIEALTLDDVGVLVVGVVDDSPAYEVGIEEGDIITKLNDISLEDKTASYLISFINSVQTDIELEINRDGEVLNFTLSAEKIIITSVTSNTFYKNQKTVGYIKISIFAANTASQFTNKLKDLEESGIDALIIDVRDNAGGYLSQAATILEMFMKEDTVLYQTKTKDSTSERKDLTAEYRDYPVIILVNGSSASASEVLAASFMENYSSYIVGETTYGKGTVQETVNVLDGSMVKITTKEWLTPEGNSINGIGITPTVEVEINDKYLLNPIFDNDNQLSTALNLIVKE